jgi:hypothetical protein
VTIKDSYSHQLDIVKKRARNEQTSALKNIATVVGNDAYQFKLQVAKSRSRKIEELNELLAKDDLSMDSRRAKEEEMSRLMGAGAQENAIEEMLISKGYGPVLAAFDGEQVKVYFRKELKLVNVVTIGQFIADKADISIDKIVLVQQTPVKTTLKD